MAVISSHSRFWRKGFETFEELRRSRCLTWCAVICDTHHLARKWQNNLKGSTATMAQTRVITSIAFNRHKPAWNGKRYLMAIRVSVQFASCSRSTIVMYSVSKSKITKPLKRFVSQDTPCRPTSSSCVGLNKTDDLRRLRSFRKISEL